MFMSAWRLAPLTRPSPTPSVRSAKSIATLLKPTGGTRTELHVNTSLTRVGAEGHGAPIEEPDEMMSDFDDQVQWNGQLLRAQPALDKEISVKLASLAQEASRVLHQSASRRQKGLVSDDSSDEDDSAVGVCDGEKDSDGM